MTTLSNIPGDAAGDLVGALAAFAARIGRSGRASPEAPAGDPAEPAAAVPAGVPARPPAVLSDRGDEVVVRAGAVVVKAHAPQTRPGHLLARLRTAAGPATVASLVAPLPVPGGELGGLATRIGGRWVSAWPAGTALSPADLDRPGGVPWATAAALLAGLHRAAPPAGLPPAAGPAKVGAALRRLAAAGSPAVAGSPAAAGAALPAGDRAVVLAAAATLPGWATGHGRPPPDRRVALCHGDWHLGQLVHTGPAGWRLIDVDDLGLGDPVWDLARPAAWYAAGLLPEPDWAAVLTGYLAAGGTALRADTDPWPLLEIPARAVTVQSAALALLRAGGGPPDAMGEAMLACCRRMAPSTAPAPSRGQGRGRGGRGPTRVWS